MTMAAVVVVIMVAIVVVVAMAATVVMVVMTAVALLVGDRPPQADDLRRHAGRRNRDLAALGALLRARLNGYPQRGTGPRQNDGAARRRRARRPRQIAITHVFDGDRAGSAQHALLQAAEVE